MFKPTAPLLGGLLWKIPWRLSNPQKIRHRRRLRRVDNIVAVLDNALKRQAASTSAIASSHSSSTSRSVATSATTASQCSQPPSSSLRHGRGPSQGSFLPTQTDSTPSVRETSSTPLSAAAASTGTMRLLARWKAEMPTEQEMLPRDKYTIFDKKVRGYRKGVHKLPKWTRVSQRLNPPGF